MAAWLGLGRTSGGHQVNLILDTVSQRKENNNKKEGMATHLCTPYGLSRIGSLNGGGIWPK